VFCAVWPVGAAWSGLLGFGPCAIFRLKTKWFETDKKPHIREDGTSVPVPSSSVRPAAFLERDSCTQ
jgi:hypothetical protein